MRKTFHFEFVLRQSSPLRNFWVCRSSLKPDNFPELSLQGLHGRRRSFGLRLRAFTSLRHGFCLGLLRAVFWQLRWYSFSAWLVCELHTGLCPLRLGHEFLLHAGLCPLLLGHGFSADFLLYSNFGDLSLFRNFVVEMAPKAALLGLHSSALPAPSTSEEAEVTRDFRNFVEQHQFYVPNINFARDEHPLRVQTRSLPAEVWLELRYSPSHFEAVCGLHPQDFVRLLRAADYLRVHFYGVEAARLLGRGREHLNWSHFAGMSYFSVDNVCYTHFKDVGDFLESLRQGRQVSKLLLPDTSEFRWVYAALGLRPGTDTPVVKALQGTMLFPELFARSTSYVANETDFYLNFKASFLAPNFTDNYGQEPSVRLWFCTSLNLLLTLLARSNGLPLRLTNALQPFSEDMLNFCFCPRSALWLACFGLQLLLEASPAVAAPILQGGIGLLSFRMRSSDVLNLIESGDFRCWNRRYIDFFVNVPSKDFTVPPHCMTSLALIRLPANFQHFFDLAWSKTSHGYNRYMHVPVRTSDFARFENTSPEDHWISRDLAVQLLRARY